MYQLDANCFINIDCIESMKSEASVFFLKMTSGDVHIVSPFQFDEILRFKNTMDSLSGQGFAV